MLRILWKIDITKLDLSDVDFQNFLNSEIDRIQKERDLEIKKAQKEAIEKAKEKAEKDKKQALEKAEKDKQDEIAKIKRDQEEKDRLEQKRKDDEENARIEKEKQKALIEKRREYQAWREELWYNELLKDNFIEERKNWKIILFKKVWEFII
jgi:hypothetical protein